MKLIGLKDLHKTYFSGKLEYRALKGIDLSFDKSEMTAIVGPSGCGKTTMLNMITGIDSPSRGAVEISGVRIDHMKEDKLARWRGKNIGIVFQFFQLFPTLNALENAMIPMDFAGIGKVRDRERKARKNLELVGLDGKEDHLPSELSGGEQQRIAIARAMANDPMILIGDEPTGNLDSKTEKKVFDLLSDLNQNGMTVIYVTHSKDLARKADRQIRMLDGKIVS